MANKVVVTVRLILGLALMVAAVIIFFGKPPILGPFALRSVAPNQFEVSSQLQLPTAGQLMFRKGKLEVTYPAIMRENETLPVEVMYTVILYWVSTPEFSMDRAPSRLEKLDRVVKLDLTSSGFGIEPKMEIAKAENEPLPTKQVWTVTPTAEGSRYLLLRIVEEKETGWIGRQFSYSYTASINGTSIEPDGNGFYKLPVTVKTFWGVSRLTVWLVSSFLTLIAWLAIYPIVVSFLKSRFGFTEKD